MEGKSVKSLPHRAWAEAMKKKSGRGEQEFPSGSAALDARLEALSFWSWHQLTDCGRYVALLALRELALVLVKESHARLRSMCS